MVYLIDSIFNLVFKIDSNPGPGAYEYQTPRNTGPKISKDLHPEATMLSRIPLKKIPGPADYRYDIKFMSEQTSFVDTSKKSSRGNKFSA